MKNLNETGRGRDKMDHQPVSEAAAALIRGRFSTWRVPGDFRFTEGPVWHPGGYFLFSDTPANCIYQLMPNGTLHLFLKDSGFTHGDLSGLSHQVGSNALAIDFDGSLLICQHGNHGIARLNMAGELETVVDTYKDRPFNSPNDLALRSDGTLFFSDPPYGLIDEKLQPRRFQPVAGIYRWRHGETKLIYDGLKYPNGLCFAPGETILYAGSNHPDEKSILRFSCDDNGNLAPAGILIRENADGIKTDRLGNVYLATAQGLRMISPLGEPLALLTLPDNPTNLCFGGQTGTDLLVTAGSCVYLLRPEIS